MNIRLRIIILLCMLSAATISWAQQTYRAHVVDSETGEPLPYTSIYVKNGGGTLTNINGDFALVAEGNDALKISYIGYETVEMKASSLPAEIRMVPMVNVLREVTISGNEDSVKVAKLLNKTWKRLCNDFHAYRDKKSFYFHRMTHVDAEYQELAEAFVEALSANNLRNLLFMSGRHFMATEDSTDLRKPHFTDSNLHFLLQVGPMMEDVPLWGALLRPFTYVSPRKNESRTIQIGTGLARVERIVELHHNEIKPAFHYDASCRVLKSEKKNARIYKIHLTSKQKSREDSLRSRVEGDIYVDNKCRLLSFDGELINCSMVVRENDKLQKIPMMCHVHVDYTHNRRFTEVEKSYYDISYGDKKVHSMLFKLPREAIPVKEGVAVHSNMLDAINKAGFAPELWTQDVILRTEEEERIIQKMIRRNEEEKDEEP